MRENKNRGRGGVRTDDQITDKLYTGHYDTTNWSKPLINGDTFTTGSTVSASSHRLRN